ncbi:MAG: hypothetical protein ABR508_09590 [Candidatus Baltobacteraceae bacterium]
MRYNKVGNGIHQIRAYVFDMLATTRAFLGPAGAQLRSPHVRQSQRGCWLVERMVSMLSAHADELAEHLQRLGGGALLGEIDDGAQPACEIALAKAMRDNYSNFSLAQAATLMLETNARALGYSSTAALAARHREEIVSMLALVREFVPLAA